MTKIEYLKQLEDELRFKISEQEMYDIMRDYAEYFEEGKKQGKTDKQIIEALGIPYVVAKQILGESSDDINVAIKKGASYLKSSFRSFKDSAKDKYSQKKAQKKQTKCSQPPKVKEKNKRNFFLDFSCVILKIVLWIFLFIPLIIGIGTCGTSLIIASITGIGLLSAFSFTVSTYTIFTASLIFLFILFGGLTIIFSLIWFIKYLFGNFHLNPQHSFNSDIHMNYNSNKFNATSSNNTYSTKNNFYANTQENSSVDNQREIYGEPYEKPSEIPIDEFSSDEKPSETPIEEFSHDEKPSETPIDDFTHDEKPKEQSTTEEGK